jgi:predicted acetyltransferase
VERLAPVFEPDRLFLAYDGGEAVASAGTLGFRLSVPGGEVPCAGVTMVGVLPGHRRRGHFRRLMERILDDCRERQEPVAVLWSTEGALYTRLGFGLASAAARIDVARDRAALRTPPEPDASVRLVGLEEAVERFAPLYERIRATTPGMPSRSEAWWRSWRLVGPPGSAGSPPMFRALLELDGEPAGYALYRVHGAWETGVSTASLDVLEAAGTSARATAEVWRFLFGLDLVERVRALHLPVDHPLFLLVREPARLRLTLTDALWVRVLDARAALAARACAGDAGLVVELSDPACPSNEGCWAVEPGPAGAAVERSSGPAELRLGAEDLGSLYLGGVSAARLVRAGRLEELRPGAAERLDTLLRSEAAPWCPEEF